METKTKLAVEKYQCSGCMGGDDTSCFKTATTGGIGCGEHYAGTIISSIGKIFLGMPKGYKRTIQERDNKTNYYVNQLDLSNVSTLLWKIC